jgi:hypothetical protein
MAEARQVLHSGGCQCGAVRYALYAEPYGTHICHCRMCQKAFGACYAPLTLIRYKDFAWTRGAPAIFQSSPDVDRGFCSACGTPLTFAHKGSDYFGISVGSLDQPERVKPEIQIGIESRIAWTAEIPQLKDQQTDQALSADRLARVVSYQHPDHDTDAWPVKG